MNQQGQQKLQNLEGRIPIKNPHLVQSLHIYNNKEILVVYNTFIHIHSTEKMAAFLPSLVCMIELSEVVSKIEKSKFQDWLSETIAHSDKSKFGEIVFGEQLDTTTNKLVSIDSLKTRLRYLSSQFLRVRTLEIHAAGHLLVSFEDRRCILLKRKYPFSLSEGTTLYNLTDPILLNNVVDGPIICSIFNSNCLDINIFSFHLADKKIDEATISRITITEQEDPQLYSLPESRKKNIQSEGFMKMIYTPASGHTHKDKDAGYLLLLYFNRVLIAEVAKFNGKNKTFQLGSSREIDVGASLKQHVIRSWQYSYPSPHQQMKIYLVTSRSIWELQMNLKFETKDPNNWHYSINERSSHTAKSNVYFINYKGEFLEHVASPQSQPNYVAHLAVETENGLMLRMVANGAHYQEGYLYLACPTPRYVVEKALYNLQSKLNGDKPWVNFHDVGWLRRCPQLRKQVMKQTQQGRCRQMIEKEIGSMLELNVVGSLGQQPERMKQMRLERIRARHREYSPGRCAVTNKVITTEEVVYCEGCQLYSIKQAPQELCCLVCWSALYSLD